MWWARLLNSIVSVLNGGAGAATSYDSIATVTVGGGGASSISFTSIPATYTHLQVRCFVRSAGASANLTMQINGDTANNYTYHVLYGDGSTVTAAGAGTGLPYNFTGYMPISSSTANAFGTAVTDILDYTNTSKYKTTRSLVGADMNGSGLVQLASGLWLNTNAITQLDFKVSNGGSNFAQYSSFALYGIKGA